MARRVRRVPAINGLDAHQSGIRIGDHVFSPMPHRRYFQLLRTRVVLDAPLSADLTADRDASNSANVGLLGGPARTTRRWRDMPAISSIVRPLARGKPTLSLLGRARRRPVGRRSPVDKEAA
jgi:hypothetical protein